MRFIGQSRHFGLRATHRGAEVHQRLVEVEHVAPRHQRVRQRPQPALHRVLFRVAAADEYPQQHARHIGVENRGAFAKAKLRIAPSV